jgi:hypothetical protein
MSARGLVHNDTFIFDGTNYDIWKICMLNHFRDMDPNVVAGILNIGVLTLDDMHFAFKMQNQINAHV